MTSTKPRKKESGKVPATATPPNISAAHDPRFQLDEDFAADGDQQQPSGDEERRPGTSGRDDVQEPELDAAQSGQPRKKKVLSAKKLLKLKEANERRGILYISRIPPHMKPHKVKQLLSQYGELGRVFCAPEDPSQRRLRKSKGGNTGKNFTEGWVEFEDKRVAKRVAVMLNGQQMGGKRRSAYHYDLWCLKYLPKFKWDHLTEEINYQKAVREQKLVAEISAAKRERDFYLSRVDKAKAITAIKERKQKQQEQSAAEGPADTGKPSAEPSEAGVVKSERPRLLRHYGQRRAKADPVLDADAPAMAADVLGMLSRKKQRVQ